MSVPKRPCRNCGVIVIDRFVCQAGRGCRKSVTKPVIQSVVAAPIPAPPTSSNPKLVNRIAIVLDASGSMSHLTDALIKHYNDQIAFIKQKAYEGKQSTYINLYTINQHEVKCLQKDAWVEQAIFLGRNNYSPYGGTPLIDGMLQAIDDLSRHQPDAETDLSYLVMVLTDGEENSSYRHDKNRIGQIIAEKNATDRWTFAYAGPHSAQKQLAMFDIHSGNFTSWDQTAEGLAQHTIVSSAAVDSYYTGRTKGLRSTKQFYPTNLTNVSAEAIKNLTNWTNQFRRLAVTQDSPISEFTKNYLPFYQIGRGYYELTKTEDIQEHKDIAIVNMKDGQIYGGHDAKKLLGLPMTGTVHVKPGDHAHYKVFVQSTSMNRKLMAGTEFLYREK